MNLCNLLSKIVAYKLSFFVIPAMVTGFPRNLKQAEALHHSETMPDIVVDLQVPFEVIIDRISKRWIHEPSGRVYNLDFNKPKVPVSCCDCCSVFQPLVVDCGRAM